MLPGDLTLVVSLVLEIVSLVVVLALPDAVAAPHLLAVVVVENTLHVRTIVASVTTRVAASVVVIDLAAPKTGQLTTTRLHASVLTIHIVIVR